MSQHETAKKQFEAATAAIKDKMDAAGAKRAELEQMRASEGKLREDVEAAKRQEQVSSQDSTVQTASDF